MAAEIYAFDIDVPAQTPVSAPVIIDLSMPAREIERVEIMVPPGAAGNVGFQFASSGTPFIPVRGATFIIASPGTLDWSLEDQITSGSWQAIAYNTGAYDHYIQARFFAKLLTGGEPAPLTAVIGNDELSQAAPVYSAPADDDAAAPVTAGG